MLLLIGDDQDPKRRSKPVPENQMQSFDELDATDFTSLQAPNVIFVTVDELIGQVDDATGPFCRLHAWK